MCACVCVVCCVLGLGNKEIRNRYLYTSKKDIARKKNDNKRRGRVTLASLACHGGLITNRTLWHIQLRGCYCPPSVRPAAVAPAVAPTDGSWRPTVPSVRAWQVTYNWQNSVSDLFTSTICSAWLSVMPFTTQECCIPLCCSFLNAPISGYNTERICDHFLSVSAIMYSNALGLYPLMTITWRYLAFRVPSLFPSALVMERCGFNLHHPLLVRHFVAYHFIFLYVESFVGSKRKVPENYSSMAPSIYLRPCLFTIIIF